MPDEHVTIYKTILKCVKLLYFTTPVKDFVQTLVNTQCVISYFNGFMWNI